MNSLALMLVLVAAVPHATGNYCAKRAGGGLRFVCLVGLIICSLYVPVVAIYWSPWHAGLLLAAVLWIVGRGRLTTASRSCS